MEFINNIRIWLNRNSGRILLYFMIFILIIFFFKALRGYKSENVIVNNLNENNSLTNEFNDSDIYENLDINDIEKDYNNYYGNDVSNNMVR